MITEVRKHGVNDRKCAELGWVAIPLAVETYGCLGCRSPVHHFSASIPSGYPVAV